MKVLILKKVKNNKINPQNAKNWMEKIFDKIIIQKGRLPSLKHYEIEDWDL